MFPGCPHWCLMSCDARKTLGRVSRKYRLGVVACSPWVMCTRNTGMSIHREYFGPTSSVGGTCTYIHTARYLYREVSRHAEMVAQLWKRGRPRDAGSIFHRSLPTAPASGDRQRRSLYSTAKKKGRKKPGKEKKRKDGTEEGKGGAGWTGEVDLGGTSEFGGGNSRV